MHRFYSNDCRVRYHILAQLAIGWTGALVLSAMAGAAAPDAATNSSGSAPNTAAKAGTQSSEDVLKWLKMSGSSKAEPKENPKPAAKETKEAVSKPTAVTVATPAAPPTPAAVPVVASVGAPVVAPVSTQAAPALAALAPPSITATTATPAASAPPPLTVASLGPAPIAELPPVATAIAPNGPTGPAALAPAAPTLRVLSREQPKFPNDAQNNGVTSGKVKALLHVAPDGSVSQVEIIEATPKRVFDRAVTNAALRWKFAPIAAAQTTEVSFSFTVDGQ
jgi:protein TonB